MRAFCILNMLSFFSVTIKIDRTEFAGNQNIATKKPRAIYITRGKITPTYRTKRIIPSTKRNRLKCKGLEVLMFTGIRK
jgi:hypothetical protein